MNESFKDEIIVASFERTNRRLWILCIFLVILLAVSNGAWIYYESQFESVTETKTIDQDVDGEAVVTGIGDIYGTGKTKNQSNSKDTP